MPISFSGLRWLRIINSGARSFGDFVFHIFRITPRSSDRFAVVFPLRHLHLSSRKEASRGWWFLFSIFQRFLSSMTCFLTGVTESLVRKIRVPLLCLPVFLSVEFRLISIILQMEGKPTRSGVTFKYLYLRWSILPETSSTFKSKKGGYGYPTLF